MPVEIRPVSEDQWQVLREVRLRALADSPTAFGSTHAGESGFADSVWQERARAKPTAETLLAWQDGAPVGIARVALEDDGDGEITSMWVRPESRGQGVGAQLMTAAIRRAGRMGISRLTLWVTDGNRSAVRLYERFGFSRTGSRQSLPSDTRLFEEQLQAAVEPSTDAVP